ncbi:MAG: hypothetical protein GY841_14595 [FCB group bacterium]|nr:hypothetical protein [FCB group bacterium]
MLRHYYIGRPNKARQWIITLLIALFLCGQTGAEGIEVYASNGEGVDEYSDIRFPAIKPNENLGLSVLKPGVGNWLLSTNRNFSSIPTYGLIFGVNSTHLKITLAQAGDAPVDSTIPAPNYSISSVSGRDEDKAGKGILAHWWVAAIVVGGVTILKFTVFDEGYENKLPDFPQPPDLRNR